MSNATATSTAATVVANATHYRTEAIAWKAAVDHLRSTKQPIPADLSVVRDRETKWLCKWVVRLGAAGFLRD